MRCPGHKKLVLLFCVVSFLVCGCVSVHDSTGKIRDLEFTVTDQDLLPPELQTQISEKKSEPFRITFADRDFLYIAEGYGKKQTTGYSVRVEELYETEDAVRCRTVLMGPEKDEEIVKAPTFPYVVVRLAYIGKDVLFE